MCGVPPFGLSPLCSPAKADSLYVQPGRAVGWISRFPRLPLSVFISGPKNRVVINVIAFGCCAPEVGRIDENWPRWIGPAVAEAVSLVDSCVMQKVPPPNDDFPEVLNAVIKALVNGETEEAERALGPISFESHVKEARPSLTKVEQAQIFVRDSFKCRYCGGRVILTPVMRVLSHIFPEQFPYVSSWRSDVTHPALWSRSACIDHVAPGSFGGDWLDPENLVTACWPCNARKGDLTLELLDWGLLPIPGPDGWSGLTGSYERLWSIAGEPDPKVHRPWISAFSRIASR
jgi:5-methylcytosine-specific restriction endonuclease McrA